MEKAKELIRRYEGLSLKAYICPAGKETIGYGHVMQAGDPKRITVTEAERLLDQDCKIAQKGIAALVKTQISDQRMAALISFVYNVGIGNFGNSTLLKRINVADWGEAAKELLRWDKARVNGQMQVLPGLRKRRQAEMELFCS